MQGDTGEPFSGDRALIWVLCGWPGEQRDVAKLGIWILEGGREWGAPFIGRTQWELKEDLARTPWSSDLLRIQLLHEVQSAQTPQKRSRGPTGVTRWRILSDTAAVSSTLSPASLPYSPTVLCKCDVSVKDVFDATSRSSWVYGLASD